MIHPHHTLPSFYAAGDAFTMPCRHRGRGLGVESPGIVYLETAASGLPVLAGGSGGAPDAVRDGETGYVVDGDPVAAAADRVTRFLRKPELAHTAGEKGRHRVQTKWTWTAPTRL
ncbi:glycosyltransferase [Streptomyces althioticus]|uniref:glycosyltransferase n=1 Tax=Streptomyces althioticus TaxID=83380 RepID=UPI00379BFC5F